MRYVKQFGIILLVTFLGEILKIIIPLQIPSSIYGLILMLLALKLKIIPLASVREAGKFMIEIMPMMFIPAAVGVLEAWDRLKVIWFPLAVITVISTVAVMVVAGRMTQFVIHRDKGGNRKRAEDPDGELTTEWREHD